MNVDNYYKKLKKHVRKKFKTDERVGWWWTKFHAARRRRVWRLSEQQNHRCCYCSRLTWVYDGIVNSDPKYVPDKLPYMTIHHMATANHFIPASHGGDEKIENIVMCCNRCNMLRDTMDAHEFWELIHTNKVKALIRKRGMLKAERDIVRSEKRQVKYEQFTMWLGYLFLISPRVHAAFCEVERIVRIEHAKRYAEQERKRIQLLDGLVAIAA